MLHTRKQLMAQKASAALRKNLGESYASFAKSFPALIHNAGLCQAVAFAQVKNQDVLKDVIETVGQDGAATVDEFADLCRRAELMDYMRLTRLTLDAATWVKRYVEAREKSAEPKTADAAIAPEPE